MVDYNSEPMDCYIYHNSLKSGTKDLDKFCN